MTDSSQADVIRIIATAGVTIESIALGLLGILYAVYAQFAQPDELGRRMPLLKPLRIMAWLAVLFAGFNAVTTWLAIWWLTNPGPTLYIACVGAFVIELVAAPFLGLYFVKRMFR